MSFKTSFLPLSKLVEQVNIPYEWYKFKSWKIFVLSFIWKNKIFVKINLTIFRNDRQINHVFRIFGGYA